MDIVVPLISIAVITAAALIVRRLFRIPLCPICAGVAGTWLWLALGAYLDVPVLADQPLVTGILAGGSAVGIAYQLEKYVRRERSKLFWKTSAIMSGFAAAYGIATLRFDALIFGLAAFGLMSAYAFAGFASGTRATKETNKNVELLEKEMEHCC